MPKNPPSLTIATRKNLLHYRQAREFDVTDEVTDPDDASNATDDNMISVWRTTATTRLPMRSRLLSYNEDEQIDLVALTWLGRGDARSRMGRMRAEPRGLTTSARPPMLLGIPLLSDYLEEALSLFDCPAMMLK